LARVSAIISLRGLCMVLALFTYVSYAN
jgi:hypothetical protein